MMLLFTMGFFMRAVAVASGGCVAAGAYFFSAGRNQKHHAQDVPEGAAAARFAFQKFNSLKVPRIVW
jgi:hypothetical protein